MTRFWPCIESDPNHKVQGQALGLPQPSRCNKCYATDVGFLMIAFIINFHFNHILYSWIFKLIYSIIIFKKKKMSNLMNYYFDELNTNY